MAETRFTPAAGGITKLSELTIDADKNWNTKNITNLGSQGYNIQDKLGEIGKNGYGYTAGGYNGTQLGTTEKYDDLANTWTAKTSLNTARYALAGFQLNGYGYTAGGNLGGITNVVEKYDDLANSWTAKTSLTTSRDKLAGFQLNGYGYTAGGQETVTSDVTEKYNDIADTWTTRDALSTARHTPAGFQLNGYGYTAGGYDGTSYVGITERYNDISNVWSNKTSLNTSRAYLAGFSLYGYGYTAGGFDGSVNVGTTEKYNDLADTWTNVITTLNTARRMLTGFSLNGYGYTAGGYTTTYSSVVEKYDSIANTWTTKTSLNTARYEPAGFSIYREYNPQEFTSGDDIFISYDREQNLVTVFKETTAGGDTVSISNLKVIRRAFINAEGSYRVTITSGGISGNTIQLKYIDSAGNITSGLAVSGSLLYIFAMGYKTRD